MLDRGGKRLKDIGGKHQRVIERTALVLVWS